MPNEGYQSRLDDWRKKSREKSDDAHPKVDPATKEEIVPVLWVLILGVAMVVSLVLAVWYATKVLG